MKPSLEQLRRDQILAKHLTELNKKHEVLLTSVATVKGLVEENKRQVSRVLNLPEGKRGERGPIGERGLTGKDGKNGIDGKDGYTPIKGKDYFTKEDKEEITIGVLARVRTPKDGEDAVVDKEEIANSVISLIKEKQLLDTDSVKGLRGELTSYRNQMAMKQAGQHGGGDTVVAGSGITLTRLPNGTTQINATGGGTGTVTGVLIATANGFAGSSDGDPTTPTLTLSTTVTGILKGNGTAISQAVANTDYQVPITLTTTGSSGAASFDGTTLNIPQYTGGGGGQVDSVLGTTDRITVDATDPANPVVDIASTYAGQSSITTLGTIGTGTWQGTAIANTYIGTGIDATKIADGSVTNAEFQYLGGVTSDIQTQLNAKQATGNYITALTGDGTASGPGSVALTLATVNANVGTFGSATQASQVTVNAKGLVTAVSNVTVTPAVGSITGLGTGVATALGVNIGTAGSFVVNGGALGTPSSGNLANCTFPTLNQNTTGSAATLTTTRTIWGQNFNGSANVTGTLALGSSSLTLTGSIGATGARATKVWTAALESTAMPTVGGTAILTSLTAPQFTTIELGNASDTTLSRSSAGVLAVEGVVIPTISSAVTLTNKRITPRVTSTTSASSLTPTLATADRYIYTALAAGFTLNNPSTMDIGEVFVLQITDNSTPQTLAFDTQYVGLDGQALPAITIDDKCMEIICSKVGASKILVSYVTEA